MSLHGCTTGLIVVFYVGLAFAQADSDPEKLKADAQAAFEHGEFDKCLDLTNRLIGQNPKDHGALYLRASSHVELGAMRHDVKEVRLGIEDARKALSVGGVSEINYYLPYMLGMTTLATLDNRKEHADVVLQESQKVLSRQLTPEQRANILFQRAGAYIFFAKFYGQMPDQVNESQKNFDLASQDFQAAIQSFPGHLGAHIGLAESYVVAKKYDKALAAFTAAVETFPKNHLVYNNRGLFLQTQGRAKEAIADFNMAIQLEPKFAIAYANRGFTYQGERNLPAAEADYSEAIRLDPNHALFHSLRGTCRLSQLNTAGAIEDHNQAIRLEPQNPVAQADLGFAKYFAGDLAGAQASLDQAVAMNANMRYLNPWRVWVLVQQRKMDAIGPILEASQKRADPDWIDELVLFLNGKISEQELVKFTEKSNDQPAYRNAQLCEAYYFIGERRMQAGDKTNALLFFEQATKLNTTDLSAYRGALFALRAAK